MDDGGAGPGAASKAVSRNDSTVGDQPTPVRAAPRAIPAGSTTGEAVAVIAAECLRQVTANVEGARTGRADSVHQMRIGLRRLRAALALFKPLLDKSATAALKADLKRLAACLAPARELDVFQAGVLAPLAEAMPDSPAVAMLLRRCEARRAAERGLLAAALRQPALRKALADTAAWVAATERGETLRPDDGDRPATDFAAAAVARRRRAIRRAAEGFAGMNEAERHRLRIRMKELRYGIEFFESLFPGERDRKRLAAALGALKRASDALGDLNDIAVRRGAPPFLDETTGEAAVAAGLVAGFDAARVRPLTAAATAALRDFAAVKRFRR